MCHINLHPWDSGKLEDDDFGLAGMALDLQLSI